MSDTDANAAIGKAVVAVLTIMVGGVVLLGSVSLLSGVAGNFWIFIFGAGLLIVIFYGATQMDPADEAEHSDETAE